LQEAGRVVGDVRSCGDLLGRKVEMRRTGKGPKGGVGRMWGANWVLLGRLGGWDRGRRLEVGARRAVGGEGRRNMSVSVTWDRQYHISYT
jgi:hypothetical protein